MKSEKISLDLFFVIENLLPGKRSVDLFRSNAKYLPIPTLALQHCDSGSALQLELFKHCKNYVAVTQGKNLADEFALDGSEEQIQAGTHILSKFVRGAYWWVDHYLSSYQEHWSERQKSLWLRDFKLLVQTVIGVGNCSNASWLLKNHGPLKALTFNTHLTPFLQQYD
ncbi:hypothetical protein [Veronia pacifica]|uniref:Uncharacterized protein n=1 Tax=Veronia pacifica TaxID=1080227 RepID=A0A1C3EIJ7_9GAMM|nr:hypothetical protein [Veronia pacifica]ODA33048.1 hypothetical protein A8L45_11845 [Veronia pacifica]